jgi:hypothetical protein
MRKVIYPLNILAIRCCYRKLFLVFFVCLVFGFSAVLFAKSPTYDLLGRSRDTGNATPGAFEPASAGVNSYISKPKGLNLRKQTY